jgi:UDP-GlcNAc:undecaprenyl-phosphate GlcNAc-1-phosphate transferase
MNTTYIIIALLSIAISSIVIYILKKFAAQLGFMDKPSGRKMHATPVPVIGGVSIAITLNICLTILSIWGELNPQILTILIGGQILHVMGVLDDRYDLSAKLRLVLQLAVAIGFVSMDIRLTSFYGVFGIEQLNPIVSNVLSVVLIMGVINAFNLIDGLDGLFGLITLVAYAAFGWVALESGVTQILPILLILGFATLVFLRHNFSKKKTFMGDGGSMFIGTVLTGLGLYLLQANPGSSNLNPGIITGVFMVPVLDSLRVYWTRIKIGYSPFRADKTHVHHLFLPFALEHKKASALITIISILCVISMAVLTSVVGLFPALIITAVVFLGGTNILAAIIQLDLWSKKIRRMEGIN